MKSLRDTVLLFLLPSLLLCSCSSGTTASTPQLVTVYSTSAAQPWLSALYDCAGSSAVLSRVDTPDAADISLRVGEPEFVDAPVYQVDQEEIWIITHRESAIPNMSIQEIQALFAGHGDGSIQVWVYASSEDVQKVFDQFVMKGKNVSPSAHVAANPQQMLEVLDAERQAIGILPMTWSMKMSGSREMYHIATVPVLALTNSEPQGVTQELIACLQK